jgi:hypothetical protein
MARRSHGGRQASGLGTGEPSAGSKAQDGVEVRAGRGAGEEKLSAWAEDAGEVRTRGTLGTSRAELV